MQFQKNKVRNQKINLKLLNLNEFTFLRTF